MNLSRRRCLIAVLLLCCLFVGTGRAQYVEDSIDVGGAWIGSLAYNSNEDVLYGQSWQAGIFFAISCDSNKVINSFELSYPRQMEYDSIDNKAYCAYEGAEEESLAVIDGRTHALIKSIRMPGATTPVWDVVSDRVYVSCQSTNKVAVVDCATDSLLTYISVGACPMKMYINTLRRKLYVLNYDAGTVSIVDMTTNQVIKTVVVGGTPNAGYYCQSADKFYSAGAYGYCTVIDGVGDSIVARVLLPGVGVDILSAAGSEDAGLVYLGTNAAYVATVSTQGDSLSATTTIGGELWGIVFYDKSGLVYCASSRNDAVYVISGDGAQVLATLPVGDYPYVLTPVRRHDRLYVGHLGGTKAYVLRDTSAGIAGPSRPALDYRGVSVTPNPFTRSVAVVWNAPSLAQNDAVRVYAQDGRLVRQARIPAGEDRWVWDGRDGSGESVPPGVYVVEAGAGRRRKVIKSQ